MTLPHCIADRSAILMRGPVASEEIEISIHADGVVRVSKGGNAVSLKITNMTGGEISVFDDTAPSEADAVIAAASPMHTRPGYCFNCGEHLTREDDIKCKCGWIDPIIMAAPPPEKP